jgi:hypothetical protein
VEYFHPAVEEFFFQLYFFVKPAMGFDGISLVAFTAK